VNRETDPNYFRGLVGARLANKDNWVVVIAGSKKFVNFRANQPGMPISDRMLFIRPHTVTAGDQPGHPKLWVMIAAIPKATDPIEVEGERGEMEEVLRVLGGVKEPIRPEQDIIVIMQPKAPRWALRLVTNYLEWIRTGEGSMEPRP
jgi:hypothetical protein